MNPISFIWIAIICTAIFCLPFEPLGCRGDDQWDASYANYAPIVLLRDNRRSLDRMAPRQESLHRPGAEHRRTRLADREFAAAPREDARRVA